MEAQLQAPSGSWWEPYKPRDSACLRIATGTLISTFIGSYTGAILQEIQYRDVDRTLKNSPAKRFMRGWVKGSFAASLAFFGLNEAACWYFERSNIYHNFFIDNSLAGLAVYQIIHRSLRRQELLSTLTTLQLRHRAQKYALFLTLSGLFLEIYLGFKRQSLILQSLRDDGSCPFILNERDLAMLEGMIKAKQFSLWAYRKAEAGDIGSFVPIAVMQEAKKTEVEVANQEVNKRLSNAIKKLVQAHTLQQMEARNLLKKEK